MRASAARLIRALGRVVASALRRGGAGRLGGVRGPDDGREASSWTAHQELGDSRLHAGRWEEAVAAYEQAARIQPSAIAPLVNMGHALCHLGRWEDAAAAYGRARRLDPGVPGVCANLGDALVRSGCWEEALGAYRHAILERPDAVSCHVNLGHALLQLNRHGEALHAYRRARELDPAMPGLTESLANVSFELGAWEAAVEEYEAAIRERSGNASAHINLGHALARLERWEQAAAAYQRALEIDPGSAEVHRRLSVARSRARGSRSATDPEHLRDVAIDLELTSVCDAGCGFCPREVMPDRKRFIAMDVVERLARGIETTPVERVVLCGIGESTLHPRLDEIVSTLATAGARVEMTTHGGARLDPARFEQLVARGLSGLHFSLNASTAATHRRVMRLRDFEQTVAHVESILELRDRSHPGVSVNVSFVVCDSNHHEVDEFVAFWRARRPSRIWLHPLNNRAGLLSPEVKAVDLEEIRRRYDQDPLVVVDVFGDRSEDSRLCKIARNVIFISADGEMRLCAMDYRRVTTFGSLGTAQLLDMHRDKLVRYLSGETGEFCQGCDFCPPGIQRAVSAAAGETRGAIEPGGVAAAAGVSGARPEIAVEPDTWAAHHARGDSLLQAGRWDEAIAAYRCAIERQPLAAASYVNIGHGLCHLGRWEAAVAAYRRARELNPGVTGVCSNLGDVLMRLERWDEAAESYAAAVRERPGDASAQANCGHALSRLGRWDEAVAVYQHAIRTGPAVASTFASLGDAYYGLNQWDDAATEYQAALRLDPDLPEIHRRVALALAAGGRWEDAAAAYRQAIAREPEAGAGPNRLRLAQGVPGLHRGLGDALLKLGRWDEAAAAHRRSDDFSPAWSRSVLDPSPEVARWVARGWPEPGREVPAGPRLMFVLDSDYGELTTVMLLLFGQEMAARSTLLLSPRLYLNNRDVLPGRTHPVTSVEDVMQEVDRERPDVVFLCSGYLFSIHELLSLHALEQLVRLLHDKGCRVATTDPFLGLLSGLGATTTVSVDIPADASPQVRRSKQTVDVRLLADLSASFRILQDLPHLYPTYPARFGQAAATDERVLSFFNPALLFPVAEGPAPRAPDSFGLPAVPAPGKPRWLFILASRDYEAQVLFHGKKAFVGIAIDRIHETIAAGRHPVFVAPHDLIQSIIAEMPPVEGVTLLTFCRFDAFLTLLLDAEFAFYWNVVSHSMLLRLMNQRPFFMFDRGHLVRNVTPLHERVVEWYYQGRGPMMLRQDRRLDLAELSALARDSAIAAAQVARGLSRAPTPDAMVAGIPKGAHAHDSGPREHPSPSAA